MAKDKSYSTKEMQPEAVATNKRKIKFNFPTLGVTVEATTLEEAQKLAIEKSKSL